jgi:polyhydroxybutyrate depolymerase
MTTTTRNGLSWMLALALLAMGVGCGGDVTQEVPLGPATLGPGESGAGDAPKTKSETVKNDTPQKPKGPDCSGKAGKTGDVAIETKALGKVTVHVGKKLDVQQPAMVVLNFHGFTSNAAQQELVTKMAAKSDDKSFIVAYPDGGGSSWNAGSCCGEARKTQRDDVGAAKELLDAISAQYCVDPSRVFATGFSNGGFLANRLACEMSETFAAVASGSGVLGLADADCKPKRPVPYMHIHGTSDEIVPYEGGKPAPLGFLTGVLLGGVIDNVAGVFRSVDSTMAFWRGTNKCTGEPAKTFEKDDTLCQEWSQCDGGAAVKLCTVKGMGHQWPGGFQNPLGGAYSGTMNATDAIIEFFEKHPMK